MNVCLQFMLLILTAGILQMLAHIAKDLDLILMRLAP